LPYGKSTAWTDWDGVQSVSFPGHCRSRRLRVVIRSNHSGTSTRSSAHLWQRPCSPKSPPLAPFQLPPDGPPRITLLSHTRRVAAACTRLASDNRSSVALQRAESAEADSNRLQYRRSIQHYHRAAMKPSVLLALIPFVAAILSLVAGLGQ
jgi:hypothetical protein